MRLSCVSLLTAQLRAKLPGPPARILHQLLLRPIRIPQCRAIHTPTAALPRMALARPPLRPAPSQTPRQILLHPGHTPGFQSPPVPPSPHRAETPNYANRVSALSIPDPVAIPVAWTATTAAAAISPAQQPRTPVCICIHTRLL